MALPVEEYDKDISPCINRHYVSSKSRETNKNWESLAKSLPPLHKQYAGERQYLSKSGRSMYIRGRYPKRESSWSNRFGSLCRGFKLSQTKDMASTIKRDFLRKEYDEKRRELGEKISTSIIHYSLRDGKDGCESKGFNVEDSSKYNINNPDGKLEAKQRSNKKDTTSSMGGEDHSRGRSSSITYWKAPTHRGQALKVNPVMAAAAAAVTATAEADKSFRTRASRDFRPRSRPLRHRHRRIDSAEEELIRRAVRHALRERERQERRGVTAATNTRASESSASSLTEQAAESEAEASAPVPADMPRLAAAVVPCGTTRPPPQMLQQPQSPPPSTATATTQTKEEDTESRIDPETLILTAPQTPLASDPQLPYNVNVNIQLLTPAGSLAAWAHYTDATGATFEVPTRLTWERAESKINTPVEQTNPSQPQGAIQMQRKRISASLQTSKVPTASEDEKESEGSSDEEDESDDSARDEDGEKDNEQEENDSTSEESVKEMKKTRHCVRKKRSSRKKSLKKSRNTFEVPAPPPPLPPVYAPQSLSYSPLTYSSQFMRPWPFPSGAEDWQTPYTSGLLPRTYSQPERLLSHTPSLALPQEAASFLPWSPLEAPLTRHDTTSFFPLTSSASAFPSLSPTTYPVPPPPPPLPPPLPPPPPPPSLSAASPVSAMQCARRFAAVNGAPLQYQSQKQLARNNVPFRPPWRHNGGGNVGTNLERMRLYDPNVVTPPVQTILPPSLNSASDSFEYSPETLWPFVDVSQWNEEAASRYNRFQENWSQGSLFRHPHPFNRSFQKTDHDINYNPLSQVLGYNEEASSNVCPLQNTQIHGVPPGFTYLRPFNNAQFMNERSPRSSELEQDLSLSATKLDREHCYDYLYSKEQQSSLSESGRKGSGRKGSGRKGSASTANSSPVAEDHHTNNASDNQNQTNDYQSHSSSSHSENCSSAARLKRELMAHVNTFTTSTSMSPPLESEEELWCSAVYKAANNKKQLHSQRYKGGYHLDISPLGEKLMNCTSVSSTGPLSTSSSGYESLPLRGSVVQPSGSFDSRPLAYSDAKLDVGWLKRKVSADSSQLLNEEATTNENGEKTEQPSNTLEVRSENDLVYLRPTLPPSGRRPEMWTKPTRYVDEISQELRQSLG